jgi:hypothetical protein
MISRHNSTLHLFREPVARQTRAAQRPQTEVGGARSAPALLWQEGHEMDIMGRRYINRSVGACMYSFHRCNKKK